MVLNIEGGIGEFLALACNFLKGILLPIFVSSKHHQCVVFSGCGPSREGISIYTTLSARGVVQYGDIIMIQVKIQAWLHIDLLRKMSMEMELVNIIY